jgi:regulator of sigma E protease
MIPHGPLSIPADRWFESKSLVRRLVILLAGVTMNVLLAVAVSVGVVATYGQPLVPPVVDSVVAGKPAAAAGVRAGDRVIAIDGTTVTRWEEVVSVISEAAGRAVTLRVLRGADTVPLVVTPAVESVTGPDGATARVGRIGVAVRQGVEREPVDAATAVRLGWTATWGMAGSVVQVLGRLVTGDVSVNQLGGPLEIARSSVAAAQSGAEALWSLIAFLSINLAVLNLLPIPLLDGGQIVLQIAETAYRRPLPLVVKEWYARIGLAAIGTLFLFVTFNDLKRILGGFFD